MPPLDGSGWTMKSLTADWLKEHWVEIASLVVAAASASASVVSGVLALFTGNPAETVTLAVAAGALGFVVGWGLPAARRARKARSLRSAYLVLPTRARELVDEAVRVGGLKMRVDSPDFVSTRSAEEAGILVTADESGHVRYLTVLPPVAQALQGVVNGQ